MNPSSNEVGSLVSRNRYPVKSMMGEEINSSVVSEKGLLGDRQFALIDPSTGKAASPKNPSRWPNIFNFRAFYTEAVESSSRIPPVRISLPDGRTILNHDSGIDTVISEAIGRPVHLSSQRSESSVYEEFWPDLEGLARRNVVTEEAMPPGTFFDLATIHILTTATIDKLPELNPAGRFEPRRFRPNLIIFPNQGNEFVENDWIDPGRRNPARGRCKYRRRVESCRFAKASVAGRFEATSLAADRGYKKGDSANVRTD
jgi:uncharacterized protein